MPRNPSKSSVTSKTSVKSQSGSSKPEEENVDASREMANADVPKSLSKSSVKRTASKTSVRSKSGSKASLKGETKVNIGVQKDPSKTSVKSVTSVRSKSGSKDKEENAAREVQCLCVSIDHVALCGLLYFLEV